MRTIFFLLTLLTVTNLFGQTTFKGQILSIVDKTPLANFTLRVDKKELIKTDSLGFFSVQTNRRKIRLSTIFGLYRFDTTVTFQNKEGIILFTVQDYDSALAVFDIQQNKPRLFCGVSFAPETMKTDADFKKEYQVSYYIVGDFLPSSITQMTSYNKVIATYLDNKYGIVWRKTVRKDVLGVTKKAGS